MFQPDEKWKNLALEVIHGLSSMEKTNHLRALWDVISQEKIDNILIQIMQLLHSAISSSSAQPPLASVYESLSNEDWERLGRKDHRHSSSVVDSTARKLIDKNALYDMLSPELRSFVKNLDDDLATEFGSIYVPETSANNVAEEKVGKGRKRKAANITADPTMTITAAANDNNNQEDVTNTYDNITPSAITIKGSTAGEDGSGFVSLKRRGGGLPAASGGGVNNNNGPHYKASDILLSLLCDLRVIADDLIIAERIANQLHSSSSGRSSGSGNDGGLSLHALVLATADIDTTSSNDHDNLPLPLDSPALSQLSRTVTKVSSEYLRTYDQSIAAYDLQKASQTRENYDRYRKRWELLSCSQGKVLLSEVPIACDRVPNPFVAASGDYHHSWSWLRGIFNTNEGDDSDVSDSQDNGDNNHHKEQVVLLEKCEVKELQSLAAAVLDTIFSAADRPCGFFESVRRCSALLAHGRNFILVDKPNEGLTRNENTIHRGLLVSTILAVFNGGQPSPINSSSKRKDLTRLVESQRIAYGMNKVDPPHYGPILIITRLTDIDSWEAACREVMSDHYGLEIMPYYGSEKDLGGYRAYLRNIASSYYGSAVLGTASHCDRSPCHIILINYETLLLEVHHFKDILWYFIILDEPWGLCSSDYYLQARNQVLTCLRSRQRCLVCSSLCGANSEQIPDVISTLTMVAPYALGMNFLFDPDLALPASNKRRWSLPLRGTHNIDYLEIDSLAMFYLQRVLAGLTVVCEQCLLLPYNMISPLFNNEGGVDFDKAWELAENMHKLAPYLLWHGYELAMLLPEASVQRAGYDHQILNFQSSPATTQGKLMIILYHHHRKVNQTQKYFDPEFAAEVSNCNLKVVGATIASSTGVSTDRDKHNQRLNVDLKDVAKKWSLAAKGNKAAAGLALAPSAVNAKQAAAAAAVVRWEAEAKEIDPDQMDVGDENITAESLLPSLPAANSTYSYQPIGSEQPTVAQQTLSTASAAAISTTSPSEPTTKRIITTHPAQQSSASGQALTFAEELNKGITVKLPYYYVSIIVHARVRFLGVFTSEQHAKMVFEAAYTQREAMLGGGGQGGPAAGGASSSNNRVALSAKFKGRVKDIKLSDGSYISDEMYAANMITNEELYEEIRRMIYPTQQALHNEMIDWSSFYHDPPGYALLRGHDGSNIIIGGLQTILGRAGDGAMKILTQKLEQSEEKCAGVIFDYHATVTLATADAAVTAPVMHVSSDPTVTKHHVLLEFSSQLGSFQVTALSPTAAETSVDGQAVRYGGPAIALQSKSLLKIGNACFIFCLPLQARQGAMTKGLWVDLMQLRINMIRQLLEQREMRRTLSLPKEEYVIAQPNTAMDEITFQRGEEEEEAAASFEWSDEWITYAVENAERRALKGVVNSF